MVRRLLEEMLGQPVRVAPAGGVAPVFHGILAAVGARDLVVDLFDLPLGHHAGRFRTEIAHPEVLVRFSSHGDSDYECPGRLHLDLPEGVDRVQRRDFNRTPCSVAVWIQPAGPHENPETALALLSADRAPDGYTLNLSPAGLALATRRLLSTGQRAFVSVDLGGQRITGIAATATRYGFGPNGSWYAAARFDEPVEEIGLYLKQLTGLTKQIDN